MADTVFFIIFGAAAIFVVLWNYLYFAKILPALDQSLKLLPGDQLSQVDQYLAKLNERDERQWFEPILRNARSVNAIYIVGFAITIALVLVDS